MVALTHPRLHKLEFDVDDFGRYGFHSPLVNPLLEDLIIAVKSLQTQNPKVGHAVIRRTTGGFHVVFPKSNFPFDFVAYLTSIFPHDFGQLWWSRKHGRVTLRISQKPIVKHVTNEYSKRLGTKTVKDKPQTILIIYPNGKVIRRKEIEEKYGDAV